MGFGHLSRQQANIQIEKFDVLPMSARIAAVGRDKSFSHKHPEMMQHAGNGAGAASARTHNNNRLENIRFLPHISSAKNPIAVMS